MCGELILNRRKRKGWYLHCVLRSSLGKQICYQFLRFPTRKLIVCKCAMNVIGCFSLRVPRVSRRKPSRKQTMPQPRPHLRLCGQNCFPQLVGRTPSAHERGRCEHEREDVAMKGKMWDVAMTMWQFSSRLKTKAFAETFRVGHPSMTRGLARNPAGCPSRPTEVFSFWFCTRLVAP